MQFARVYDVRKLMMFDVHVLVINDKLILILILIHLYIYIHVIHILILLIHDKCKMSDVHVCVRCKM